MSLPRKARPVAAVCRGVLLAVLVLLPGLAVRAQQVQWVSQQKSAFLSEHLLSATNRSGHTCVLGGLQGQLIIGNDTLRSFTGAGRDIYLAYFDPAGQNVWSKKAGDPSVGHAFATALAHTGQGTVFAAGEYHSGIRFDTLQLAGTGNFLSCISRSGQVKWLQKVDPGTSLFPVTQAAADRAGNCYLFGTHSSAGQLGQGPATLGFYGTANRYVAKCDSSGRFVWAQQVYATGSNTVLISSLTLAGDSVCYLSGVFRGAATFGTGAGALTLSSTAAGLQPFLARLNASGTFEWVRQGTQTGASVKNFVAADQAGNLYVAGISDGPVSFGSLSAAGAGLYVARFDQAGSPRWLRQTNAQPELLADFQVAPDGNAYFSGTFSTDSIAFGLRTLYQENPGLSRDFFLVSLDTSGTVRWAQRGGGAQSDIGRSISFDAQGNVYLSVVTGGNWSFSNLPVTGPAGGMLLKIAENKSRVTGSLYEDLNANGQRDAGEPLFTQQLVLTEALRPEYFCSTSTGLYSVLLDTGRYELSLPRVPAYYSLTQGAAGYQGYFAAPGQVDSARHFGLVPVPNQQDIHISLTPVGPARPGFPVRYQLTLENQGTAPIGQGTVLLHLPAGVTYSGSKPAALVTGPLLTWNYSGLAPRQRQHYTVTFEVPAATALGTVLSATAQANPVTGDLSPADNTAQLQQTVTGSFDPNDMQVSHTTLTPAEVQAGQYVSYTIRFQNQGTDTAFTVLIKDLLDYTKLDPGSLDLVSMSHSFVWWPSGSGLLTMRFSNIRLPQQSVSAINSQGFVHFRLRPKRQLLPGNVILNSASITFDFSQPVATNEVNTAINAQVGTAELAGPGAFRLYPNPAMEAVVLDGTAATAGTAVISVRNALGQEVQAHRFAHAAGPVRTRLEMGTLPPGLYLLQVSTADGVFRYPLVRQ